MRTRAELEKIEDQTLASFAVKSSESQGRLYDEPEHDYRTCFQRDRDRIVHTSAFRRLEYKTQVFVYHIGDYYRTRLTHTLEVAQIGRTIARALGLNENLVEAICLAHDLGHTPFGHAGQDILHNLMKEHGGFEHNKQSFRIVTHLENPYPNFKGLNLTYEVLEGISKHNTEYQMPDGSPFIKEGQSSLEAQIANIADEIAYNNHDVDDGLKSGLIRFEDLQNISIWEPLFQKVTKEGADLSQKQKIRSTVKLMINALVTDLMTETSKRLNDQNIQTLADVRSQELPLVGYSETIKNQNAELKRFLYQTFYRHKEVVEMADKADKVITTLFDLYTQDLERIPKEFRQFYTSKTPTYKIVCDYIAGMTDRFALRCYDAL